MKQDEIAKALQMSPDPSVLDPRRMQDSVYSTKFSLNRKKSEDHFKNSVF